MLSHKFISFIGQFSSAVLVLCAATTAMSGEDPLKPDPLKAAEKPVAPRGSAFIQQDHRGVVDQLIHDEQARYARENAKPEPEPEPTPDQQNDPPVGFDLNSGPSPYFQPRRRPQEPHYVGVFGAPGAYRVEVYYQGSTMDYAVGDRLPGDVVLTGVRSQYITVTPIAESSDVNTSSPKRLYLTSRQAVEAQAEITQERNVSHNDLPPGLYR